MTRADFQRYLQNRNVQAFLRVIRTGEGTVDNGGYLRLFGGGHFTDYADHPRKVVTAKCGGKMLSSSAAGAYQILRGTWDGLVKQYGFPDFSVACQDEAAVALIAGRKALQHVVMGEFEPAIAKCSKEWASLPGSPYGQPVMKMEKARKVYEQNGGVFVPEQKQEEQQMVPFIAAALPALIEAAPSLIRIFGDSPQAEKNAKAAEAVAQIAKDVTGEATMEGAVTKIQAEPEVAQRFQQAADANFLELSAMTEKSIAAAREYARTDAPMFWNVKFIHILSLVFVLFCGTGGIIILVGTFSAELKGAVTTLMLIGGWTGVKEFWFGSSYGSHKKDEQRGEVK